MGVTNMHLAAFGHNSEEITCPTIKLKLSLGSCVFSILFIVTEKVAMCLEVPGLKSMAKMLKGEGVKLADGQARDRVTDIAAIIGADHFSKFIRGTHRVRGVNLFNSTGGHIIYGSLPYGLETSQLNEQSVIVSRVQLGDRSVDPCVVQDIVEPLVQQLWDLEAIGIQEERFTTGEQNALTSFSQSIFYDGFKYWVRLPWKRSPSVLPTNYRMAIGQLNSLLQQLRRQGGKFKHYCQVIADHLQNDFIEEVADPQICGYYMPHHAAMKDSVTTPVRVVFNASAKLKPRDLLLNDILETGPSLTEKLIDSLLNFCVGRYALIADISKAFLRVGLQEIDRDYVRFLWSEDPDAPPKTFRFKSVPFGSTSSPFILQATLRKHFEGCEPRLRTILDSSFYVDNFQYTSDNETELYELQSKTTGCLAEANFPLQEWNSNSADFNFYLKDDARKECPTVLGVWWDTTADVLQIKSVTLTSCSSVTKRRALPLIS